MNFYDDDNNETTLSCTWFIGICLVWGIWMLICGMGAYPTAYNQATTQWQAQSGFYQLFHRSENPDQVGIHIFFTYLIYFIIGGVVALPVSVGISGMQFAQGKAANARKKQKVLIEEVEQIGKQSQASKHEAELSHLKAEMIDRIGQIKSFVLIVADKSLDQATHTIALQDAHREITAIEKKKAQGKMPPQVLKNPVVLECATALSDYLFHLSMADEQLNNLNNEIRRIFSITEPPQARP